MAARIFISLLCLICFCPAMAASMDYDNLEIWALDQNGRPANMGLRLGQFANYLTANKAYISISNLGDDVLEMRVSDPRMNLDDHLIHTYFFELNPEKNIALCKRFLLNGEEVGGEALLHNTTFLFKLVAGLGRDYPSEYQFKTRQNIPVRPYSGSTDSDASQKSDRVCGKVLIDLPVNKSMSLLLLKQDDGNHPYFYLGDQCRPTAPEICARIVQKIQGDSRIARNGIMLEELNFIHQCEAAR